MSTHQRNEHARLQASMPGLYACCLRAIQTQYHLWLVHRQAYASRPEAEANLDACVREEQHEAMAVDTLTSGNPFAHQPWTLKPTGRSMFGHQTDSRKSSLPQYSFVGGTNRDQARGVFVSPGHLEVSLQCKQKAQ